MIQFESEIRADGAPETGIFSLLSSRVKYINVFKIIVSEMSERFAEVSEPFVYFSERFRDISERFGDVSERLGDLRESLGDFCERLADLRERLGELSERFVQLSEPFILKLPSLKRSGTFLISDNLAFTSI